MLGTPGRKAGGAFFMAAREPLVEYRGASTFRLHIPSGHWAPVCSLLADPGPLGPLFRAPAVQGGAAPRTAGGDDCSAKVRRSLMRLVLRCRSSPHDVR